MNETCKTCKYINTLYVPPVDEYIDMPKDRFVCTYFSRDGQVMYLGYGEGMCEVWSEKEDERETKATVVSKFVEDGVLYEQIIRETKYCDRNICASNENNGVQCDECEVTKSQRGGE